jgi:glucose/arabinose dehydrogenase
MLITEKDGGLIHVKKGSSEPVPVSGMPQVFSGGQGGLMDVSLHPDFAKNSFVYFTRSTGSNQANRTTLYRARLQGTQLVNGQELFRVSQDKDGGGHFGSRITWLPDGTMLMSIGDGGNPPTRLNGEFIRTFAQNRGSHLGKVLRLDENGRPPADNPFSGQQGAAAEVYSYGHRNIQGIARDPETGRVYATEHGAKGGDELNLVEKGKNYGWPLATHSTEYWGPKITENRSLPGKVQPKVVWTPSTGPSGLAFYSGDRNPAWKGDLFAGGLASRDVRRVDLDAQGKVIGQQRMEIGERVRDVRQGPDGFLYVLTDEGNGRLIRIDPS